MDHLCLTVATGSLTHRKRSTQDQVPIIKDRQEALSRWVDGVGGDRRRCRDRVWTEKTGKRYLSLMTDEKTSVPILDSDIATDIRNPSSVSKNTHQLCAVRHQADRPNCHTLGTNGQTATELRRQRRCRAEILDSSFSPVPLPQSSRQSHTYQPVFNPCSHSVSKHP